MTRDKVPGRNLLATAAVANWLGISARTLRLWAECKEIPALKVGRQWRFREDEIKEWLQLREGKTGTTYDPVAKITTAISIG
jgi:excisionase family DNA binding protein